jgi:5-methylcytosine-specific restriction endonuclease McrA
MLMGWRENRHLRRLRTAALKAQHHRCLYCRSPLSADEATAEHKLPRSRGGGRSRSNIGAACYRCNVTRADVPQDHFYALIDRRQPPQGAPSAIILIWASRRIWGRTQKACARIKALAR